MPRTYRFSLHSSPAQSCQNTDNLLHHFPDSLIDLHNHHTPAILNDGCRSAAAKEIFRGVDRSV